MNRDKREPESPAELESHFIMRFPEEPAKQLKEVLRSGENMKNRLTIQIDNDIRHGEVRFDNWFMHAKIVDLPTITESLKSIDNKSFYKCADVCQMMLCKLEPDQSPTDEESVIKNKIKVMKDSFKVDKKFLWPHGITPPTKNVRKRRFRKTLKKKCVEAPEIKKEVKRLLRADNEAVSITWEVVKEEDEHLHAKAETRNTFTKSYTKKDKKLKAERMVQAPSTSTEPSNIVDIFGGAVSDSEEEDNMNRQNINMETGDSHLFAYDTRLSDTNSMKGVVDIQNKGPTEFDSEMFEKPHQSTSKTVIQNFEVQPRVTGQMSCSMSSEEETDYTSCNMSKDNMQLQIEELQVELEELKQRRQRTQNEIAGLENLTLRQRFQDILQTLNQDIMYKEMEYQGLLVLQNSEDIF